MSTHQFLETAEFGSEVSGKQTTSEYDVHEQMSNDDDDAVSAEFVTTQLSSSLLVTYLYDQIEDTDFSEIQSNQLENILIRINVVLSKFEDDKETKAQIIAVKNEILSKLVAILSDKYDFNFAEFGHLEPNSENYEVEVVALYEFFIVNRVKNITDFFVNFINTNSKHVIDRYKGQIQKTNQTFREIKKRTNTQTAYLIMASALCVEDQPHIEQFVTLGSLEQALQNTTFVPDTLETAGTVIDALPLVIQYLYGDLDHTIAAIATEVRTAVANKSLLSLEQ